jgi:hypothetical protein
MYSWCQSRDYFRLWAYMWINWYQPDRFYGHGLRMAKNTSLKDNYDSRVPLAEVEARLPPQVQPASNRSSRLGLESHQVLL